MAEADRKEEISSSITDRGAALEIVAMTIWGNFGFPRTIGAACLPDSEGPPPLDALLSQHRFGCLRVHAFAPPYVEPRPDASHAIVLLSSTHKSQPGTHVDHTVNLGDRQVTWRIERGRFV